MDDKAYRAMVDAMLKVAQQHLATAGIEMRGDQVSNMENAIEDALDVFVPYKD